MLKRCNRLKSKISRLVVYRFGTAKIVNKHSKYFLHIPVTYDVPESQISDICNVVGIDRGVNFVVATYDSRHKSGFIRGRTIKQKKILLKTAQGTPPCHLIQSLFFSQILHFPLSYLVQSRS